MKMKAILVIALLAAGMNAFAQEKQSYLYVYRGGQFGSALTNFSIFVDGKKICKLSNDKYFKIPLSPGKHEIEAKKSGMDLGKKETFISFIVEAGKDNYISCTVKRSITRARLEMTEVVPSNGIREIESMKEDKCTENQD